MSKACDDREKKQPYVEPANKVAELLDADILLINSHIVRGLDDELIIQTEKRKRRKNVFLMLVTPGGDADAAYRVARCLQDHYECFISFVSGYCKSAGTLCVLGANEIVMSDMGELGPLDVQIHKKDELFEYSSGLVAAESLAALQKKAFEMFEEYFLSIKLASENQITFKTATEIAVKMSVGLMEPLYKQIDPIQVGENARSMKIAKDYGKRLMLRSKNFNEKTLDILIETYPTHGFVIDKSEAEKLFNKVRNSSEEERKLRKSLGDAAIIPRKQNNEIMMFLSDEIKGERNEPETSNIKDVSNGKTKQRTSAGGNKKNSRRTVPKEKTNTNNAT